ncbi:Uncharacterized protein LCER1_G003566 [Lachnellula cervina]|uniref:LCCL domain-containing protein n=1 Tax=Lachnellula cervina TaxID=1316786 RepID=A0A7D8YM85_9HELO|nr:Uncharacterized protein LCER1_G003566 [Lachnellula cervina]
MNGHDAEGQDYGPREDDAASFVVDEEAQPLNLEGFEIDETNLRSAQQQNASSLAGRSIWQSVVRWIQGPQNPQTQVISPWMPKIQQYPIQWLDQTFPSHWSKIALLLSLCVCWLGIFGSLLTISTSTGNIKGSNEIIQYLHCTDTFWYAKNGCGLDGNECQPFNGSSFAFRCPANCAGVQLLNPRMIGDQEINYRPLVVGGPVYRGDSFVCGAAIHAGIVSDFDGGCGVVSKIGKHDGFLSTTQNGISSVGFESHFPLSFTFSTDEVSCRVKDLRWIILAVSIVFTTLISVFTASPMIHFATLFLIIFAHVSLVSDPSGISYRSQSVLADLFSNFVGRFLPAAFCAVVIYMICVKRTLLGLTAPAEKTILWLGGCWFGALSNYTFEWIPISRLTSHDLEQQPGAKLALAIIVLVIVLIIAQQIYYFRLEGRLPRYLAVYGMFIAAILASLALPGLNLRIHHYILALLLLPGTSMQTRPSLLYQGLLIGLFINGIARWGFDPVLQTAGALRGDGAFGSLIPNITDPAISLDTPTSNIIFDWDPPPLPNPYDGISVLVNDVERYRSYFGESTSAGETFTWERTALGMPEYFRFGYLKEDNGLDYTNAGIWNANGTWTEMAPKRDDRGFTLLR